MLAILQFNVWYWYKKDDIRCFAVRDSSALRITRKCKCNIYMTITSMTDGPWKYSQQVALTPDPTILEWNFSGTLAPRNWYIISRPLGGDILYTSYIPTACTDTHRKTSPPPLHIPTHTHPHTHRHQLPPRPSSQRASFCAVSQCAFPLRNISSTEKARGLNRSNPSHSTFLGVKRVVNRWRIGEGGGVYPLIPEYITSQSITTFTGVCPQYSIGGYYRIGC